MIKVTIEVTDEEGDVATSTVQLPGEDCKDLGYVIGYCLNGVCPFITNKSGIIDGVLDSYRGSEFKLVRAQYCVDVLQRAVTERIKVAEA